MIDDPKARTKGSTYIKKGIKIYEVHADFKQHPTLTRPDGNPLDVWIIDTPQDLEKQLKAIQSGKG